MEPKKLLLQLGFLPKENTSGIYAKKYANCGGYSIEVDVENEKFNLGKAIVAESKTTLNFLQQENWVVLECVDRLLTKGYQPKNIILEKTWATGHGTSGRLDILVTRDDGTAYLMIECKTWGEYEKASKKIQKDGGQLFTYFQQDKDADVLMLYASELDGKEVKYRNEIIKIEEDHRQTGNVKDFYERWNKLPKANGIFDSWVTPYEFQSKALTKKDLQAIRQEDSSFIFNRFLEILRHNVVSDKPNAFNKIFTLFLCKIIDEYTKKDSEQLDFQWLEGEDDHVTFQLRLTDLYSRGMRELLEKQVTDYSNDEIDRHFYNATEEVKNEFKAMFTKIRLEKNNEFAIKEVYDHSSFLENAKVVKEVVELLQIYQLRYNYRQQFLSDFFELLLTTGLKQESGQFFTPVPVARFIIRSLPIRELTDKKLKEGSKNDLLPRIIDYAAGSGHFLTESMEELQKYIEAIDEDDYAANTKRPLKKWKNDPFEWADDYVYAIEKDYRLVKTAKVGCYLHGDGLAKVIHGDGLGDFSTSAEFKDLLKETDRAYPQDNKQFDIVISNPPYSVSAFKGTLEEDKANKAFDLYKRLTDQSSEIECLFVERTKQLLKDGGMAGIILPSSILSNTGIYSQAREIILKYFEIISITVLGSGTFMATGTNTVVLFLRRRNNTDAINVQAAVQRFFTNQQDVTINGVEKPVGKYINHVWEGLTLSDYITLLKMQPNEAVQQHEIYQEYDKKIKTKNFQNKWTAILELEQEKLTYFILAYPQEVVLVKTGEKAEEKKFLGYEFSNRRGSEGIHPIQRSKTIDECTRLFDPNAFDNPEKASTYIYKAFKGEYPKELPTSLKKNIYKQDLVDMMTFDRVDFDKGISTAVKKKVKIESSFEQVKLENLSILLKRGKSPNYGNSTTQIIKSGQARGYYDFDFTEKFYVDESFILDERKLQREDILINSSGVGTAGRVTLFDLQGDFVVDSHITIMRLNQTLVLPRYVLNVLGQIGFKTLESMALGQSGQIELSLETIKNIKIPLPPKDIQEKIVAEIEVLENKEGESKAEVERLKGEMKSYFKDQGKLKRLDEVCELRAGKFVKAGDINRTFSSELYPCYGGNGLRGYTKTYTNDGRFSLVGRQGALCGNVHLVSGKFHATEHALVVYPKNGTDNVWLHYQLVSMNLNQYATGTAQPGLSVMNLNPIEIPVPPLSEQQKIVFQIEKIEAQIAELEQNIATIPAQKEAILKKYLE